MAHKKAGGSSRNGRDTEGRRLGIKIDIAAVIVDPVRLPVRFEFILTR